MSRTSASDGKSRVEKLKKFIWVIVIILLVSPTVITCMIGIRFNRLSGKVEEMANQSPVAMSIDNRNSIELLSSALSDLSATMAETNVKIQILEESLAEVKNGATAPPASAEDSETISELKAKLASLEEEYKTLLEKFDALSEQINQGGNTSTSVNYDDEIKALNQRIDALSVGGNVNANVGYLEGEGSQRVEIPYTGK